MLPNEILPNELLPNEMLPNENAQKQPPSLRALCEYFTGGDVSEAEAKKVLELRRLFKAHFAATGLSAPRRGENSTEKEPGSLDAFGQSANGFVQAVEELLTDLHRECGLHVEQQLLELLGAIAERFGATSADLFLMEHSRKLRTIVTHNIRPLVASLDEPRCIVAHVARTKHGYYSNCVSRDPLYRKDRPETESEIAVPIVAYDDRLLGVLNLECNEPGAFNPADVEDLQGAASVFTPHLLVVKALRGPGDIPFAWHPEIHGWDVTSVFQKLCHRLTEAIDRDFTKCSIWYADHAKRRLFVYATSGYDNEYRKDATLDFNSFTGDVVLGGRPAPDTIDPLTDPKFVRKDKARRMGVARVVATQICRPAADQSQTGISALNIYLNDPRLDTEELRTAVVQIASLIGRIAARFEIQRQEFCLARLHYLLYEKPNSSEDDFDTLCDFFKDVFGADGVSWFAHQKDDRRLYCVATTGMLPRASEPARRMASVVRDEPVFYDLQDEEGFTLYLLRTPGRPLRINNLLDPDERGLPDDLPKRPLLKHCENFSPRNNQKRRFLAVGVACWREEEGKTLDPLGVVRVLRRPDSKPFTACDERLLLQLVSFCRKPFLDWRRSLPGQTHEVDAGPARRSAAAPVLARGGSATADAPFVRLANRRQIGLERRCADTVVEAIDRLESQVPTMRSTRTPIEELMRDLYSCYAQHGIRKTSLYVRHPSIDSNLALKIHAEYSESSSAAGLVFQARAGLHTLLSTEKSHETVPQFREDVHVLSMSRDPDVQGASLWAPVKAFARIPGFRDGKFGFEPAADKSVVEGVLVADFGRGIPWETADLRPIVSAARRLAAIWGVADPRGTSRTVIAPEVHWSEWSDVLRLFTEYLRETLCLSETQVVPFAEVSAWPIIHEPRDAALFGVRRSDDATRLAIPLRLGCVIDGALVCDDCFGANLDRIRELIERTTGIWSNLSFARFGFNAMQFAGARRPDGSTLWTGRLVKKLGLPIPPSAARTSELPRPARLFMSLDGSLIP